MAGKLTESAFIEPTFLLDDEVTEADVEHFVLPVQKIRKSIVNDSFIFVFLRITLKSRGLSVR